MGKELDVENKIITLKHNIELYKNNFIPKENEDSDYYKELCRDLGYMEVDLEHYEETLSYLKHIEKLETENKQLKEKLDMFNNVIEFIGELKDNCSYQIVELKK